MAHLLKDQFPISKYNKIQDKKFGPYRILNKINDNAYTIDLPFEFGISSTFKVVDLLEYFALYDGNSSSRSSFSHVTETDVEDIS